MHHGEPETMHLQGTKRSKQRERIYHVLRKTRAHPTAEWVHEKVREEMPRISLGTVYRNLHVLTQQGKIRELDFGEGTRRYDAFMGEHYHFVCEQCGNVKDLEIPQQKDLNERVRTFVPGEIRGHKLDFFGTCSDCLSKA